MPNDEVKISQLPVGTLGNGSLFETSEVSGEGYASTKIAASDLGNYINTVLQYAGLKTAVLNVVGAVNSVLAIFADEYNTTTYYNPGWYCIKDGVLYVCQNDTHGTWSEGAWTETTVDEALRSMKSEIEYFDLIKFNSDNVAAFHSTTTAYSKGDYCINDEDLVLYRAKVDIPVGTAWNDTKWEVCTIGSELKSLNDSRLDDLPIVTMPYASVATFNTDRAVPLTECKCTIVARQASGTPTPSVPLDITGFSKCNIIQSDNNEFSNRMKGVFDGTYGFVDLGTLTWIVGTGGQARFVSSAIQSLVQIPSTGVLADIVCSKYKTVLNTAIYNDGETGIAIHSSGAIWVRDTTYTTVEAFTAAMSGVYLLYRFDTATTPSITDAQIMAITAAFSAVPVSVSFPRTENLFNGTNVLNAWFNASDNIQTTNNGRVIYVPCVPNMKYKVAKTAGARFAIGYTTTVPADGVAVSGIVRDNTASELEMWTGANAQYIVAFIYSSSLDTETAEAMIASVVVTVSVADVVYGGELNVLTGELSITKYIVDLGSLTWTYRSENTAFFCDAIANCTLNPQDCKCSFYEFNASANGTSVANISGALSDKQIAAFSNATNRGRFVVKDTTYTDASDFTTAVTGAKLIYPLNEPVIVQLTPTQLTALLGQNNIFCDTGDTSVAYRESAQKYVDERVGILRTLLYSFNLSQGGAWLNTGINVTNINTFMFERVDNSNVTMQVVMNKANIAVYTGGADVYTLIYSQDGKPMNVRIYNNTLYVSYNGTSSAIYVTNVYSLTNF